MYLDYAERQARKRRTVTMAEWSDKLDAFLKQNEEELLTHAGTVKAEVAKKIAEERYDEFDKKRKITEAKKADEEDLKDWKRWKRGCSIIETIRANHERKKPPPHVLCSGGRAREF